MLEVLVFLGVYLIGMAVTACCYVIVARYVPRIAADAMFSYCDKEWSDQQCRNELMDWIDVVVIAWWLTIVILLFMTARNILFAVFSWIGTGFQWLFGPSIKRATKLARRLAGADPET
jgi:hypothetical protein